MGIVSLYGSKGREREKPFLHQSDVMFGLPHRPPTESTEQAKLPFQLCTVSPTRAQRKSLAIACMLLLVGCFCKVHLY